MVTCLQPPLNWSPAGAPRRQRSPDRAQQGLRGRGAEAIGGDRQPLQARVGGVLLQSAHDGDAWEEEGRVEEGASSSSGADS